MLRVNQAGEYGATRIYAGQLAVMGSRGEGADEIAAMAAQEAEHLRIFNTLIAARGVRPTALQPFWHVAGFALGAATALIGPKAAMACTAAIETEIDRHYSAQLEELGTSDEELSSAGSRRRAGSALSAAVRRDPAWLPAGDPPVGKGLIACVRSMQPARASPSIQPSCPYIGSNRPKEPATMLRQIIAGIALAPAALLLVAPAQAQSAEEKVNQLIIYGDDACPQSTANEITVCARKDEAERFRIPEGLRESSAPDNRAWSDRVLAYETVGATGTLSCSPVGPGGMTGCVGKLIDTAYAEKRGDPNIRFSQLIADERARRLATIDQEAAETQARVEVIEREYEAKQRALQDPESVQPAPPATSAEK